MIWFKSGRESFDEKEEIDNWEIGWIYFVSYILTNNSWDGWRWQELEDWENNLVISSSVAGVIGK